MDTKYPRQRPFAMKSPDLLYSGTSSYVRTHQVKDTILPSIRHTTRLMTLKNKRDQTRNCPQSNNSRTPISHPLPTYFHPTPANATIAIPTLPPSLLTTPPPLSKTTLNPPSIPPFSSSPHPTNILTVAAIQNAASSTPSHHATPSTSRSSTRSNPPSRSVPASFPGTHHGSKNAIRVFACPGRSSSSTSCSSGSHPTLFHVVAAVTPPGFSVR